MKNKMENFQELVEKSKELSKKRFLEFAKGIYGVDEVIFEHLWEVPIIASYEDDSLITTTLSTKSEDEILDILDNCIENELGDYEAAFIPFGKLAIEFEPEEIEEYLSKLNEDENIEKYNAFIVYNESKIKNAFGELLKNNDKARNQKNQDELDKIFVDYTTKIFTHERCHLNANVLVCDREESDLDELINGAEMSLGVIDEKSESRNLADWSDRNEVLIDTLSQMINNYEEGDKIEDCLYKIIKARNGKSQYKEFDDKAVLSIYALFPEELTEWAMFGAYDQVRINLLEDKFKQVFGGGMYLDDRKIIEKLGDYCNQLDKETLSEKQIEMIGMLGVKNIGKIITREELKEVVTSEKTMSELSGSVLDVKAVIEKLLNENKDIEER